MSEGLEALERLKMFPIYQEIKRMPQRFRDRESINIDLSIIEKELKALEIIKEKPQASFFMFIHKEDFRNEEYGFCSLLTKELTQEEYELLKEVLL